MIDLEKEFGGRTVFVTGGDGFIGSHLIDKLIEVGADVRVLVESVAHNPLINIGHQKEHIKITRGNLTDKHSLDEAIKTLKSSQDKPIIFHLAAQAHVGESWVRPIETLMTNTIGTYNLLQSIVDSGIEISKFDYAGTAEEYGHNPEIQSSEGVHLHEKSPINPTSIYATSKLAGDFLTLNFFHAYGMPNVVTRMFNNFGPRQSPRYITGVIITQALLRDKILLGNLTPRRDFTYVGDGILAHMHIAAKGKPGETYCYGYGKDISIKEWAELIVKVGRSMDIWSEKEVLSDPRRFEPGTSGFRPGHSDVMKLIVGYQKLHDLSGWEPKTTWEEGLANTIKWYAANKDKWMGIIDW